MLLSTKAIKALIYSSFTNQPKFANILHKCNIRHVLSYSLFICQLNDLNSKNTRHKTKELIFVIKISSIDQYRVSYLTKNICYIYVIRQISPSFVVRLPLNNPKPPIHLLQQYHPHQLMRKCHWRKRQFKIRPLQHLIT